VLPTSTQPCTRRLLWLRAPGPGWAALAVSLAVIAACGSDVVSPDTVAPTPSIQPAACSLLGQDAVRGALAVSSPTASPGAVGTPTTPEPVASPLYTTVSTVIGRKQVTAGECMYTTASGAQLVVTVIPKVTVAALGIGGSALGPGILQTSSTATLIAVERGGATIEIVLDLSGVSATDRANRLATLASVVLSAPVPTVAPGPSAVASATSSASATAAAAPGTKVTGQTAAQTVKETDQLQFNPTSARLKSGSVIEWMNSGSIAHNVTFDDYPGISSGTMQGGDVFEVRFTQAGTYDYHCTFHPGMNGSLTVS
jgi:plastocyanin